MDSAFHSLDWSLVQSFLAVAETGSLSAAAKKLKSSQPTVGRQIKQMEQQLNVDLFIRQPRGLIATEIGQSFIPAARQMRDAIGQIALTAAGQQTTLQGTVRITSSEMTSHVHLPPILARIRKLEPDIELELAPTDTTENLLFREADIAIRMYRPTQLDLITQHVGDLPIGVYAAKSYWAEHGKPQSPQEFMNHIFVGYDRNEDIIQGMRAAGMDVDRHFFGMRCDNNIIYWDLVRQGCGIGFSQKGIADSDDLVEELDLPLDIPPLQVWLTAHETMRTTPRVRRVWDLLYEGLKPLVS